MTARKTSRRKQSKPITKSQYITWSDIPAKLTKGVAVIVTLAAFAAAWITLGLPVPATIQYVQEQVKMTVDKIRHRTDSIEELGLQNRLETLNQSKRSGSTEKFDLELRYKTNKDEQAKALIQQRLQMIEEENHRVEDQLGQTSTRLRELRK